MSFNIMISSDVKGKKRHFSKFIYWDFFENSYLPHTRLELDDIYTIKFLKRRTRCMGDLTSIGEKIILEGFSEAWGNGVFGLNFCLIFSILVLMLRTPIPITHKFWNVVPSTLVECHTINF
jgi:hypothetical protein